MPKISEQKKDAVRSDILKSARDVFIRKGYEAATMKDIVLESGRSFGGVYMYFANKEELFYALLKSQYENMEADFTSEREVSGWKAVDHFLNAQLERAKSAENGLAACMYEFFIAGRRGDAHRAIIAQRHQAIHNSIEGLIRNGIHKGEFHPVYALESLVHVLISFLDGVFLESIITGPENIQIEDQFNVMKGFMRSVLCPI